MLDEDVATLEELEANVAFLRGKSLALGKLLDDLIDFKSNIEKFDLSAKAYQDFMGNLADVLLRNETEREILEKDLQKEKFLLGEVLQ